MNPKSGKTGTPVAPTEPAQAEEADVADPGVVEALKAEQTKTRTGKYGTTQLKPHQPDKKDGKDEKAKTSWIAIEMKDEADQPVVGEAYQITLPDGETVASGSLDEKGCARVEGIESGSCKITFPNLDKSAWEEA
jgi:type VI secretion system secreted protein VgrG